MEKVFELSNFIFRGKVLKTGSTNLKSIKASDHTAVVGVEEIYRASPAMKAFRGRPVTVLLRKPTSIAERQTLYFFTSGTRWGENLAVREEGHFEGGDTPKRVDAMIARHKRNYLAKRIDAADAVVTGTVQGLSATSPAEGPSSEHDPEWWKASILVSSVQKGNISKGAVVEVYFANSRDIAWYKKPKFRAGDRGVVLLVKNKVIGAAGEHYVADDPRDFLRVERLHEVMDAVRPVKEED